MTELLCSLVGRLGAIRPTLQFVSVVRTTKSFGCEVERREERSEKFRHLGGSSALLHHTSTCVGKCHRPTILVFEVESNRRSRVAHHDYTPTKRNSSPTPVPAVTQPQSHPARRWADGSARPPNKDRPSPPPRRLRPRSTLRVAPKSRRALRRERGPSKPGKRARRRGHVGSFNVVGLRRPHKRAGLARAFAERKRSRAGVSEAWMVGTGRNELYGAESKARLVHAGLDSKDSPARGKWGIEFCLSARACKRWKQSGQQLMTKSARVCPGRDTRVVTKAGFRDAVRPDFRGTRS
jgi:hypothetical protein